MQPCFISSSNIGTYGRYLSYINVTVEIPSFTGPTSIWQFDIPLFDLVYKMICNNLCRFNNTNPISHISCY